jgi:hypothetical protein
MKLKTHETIYQAFGVIICITGVLVFLNILTNSPEIKAQQQIIRGGGSGGGGTNSYTGYYNSLNTNVLGTNFQYNPTTHVLTIYSVGASAGGISLRDTNGNLNGAVLSDGSAGFNVLITAKQFQMTNGAFSGGIIQGDANGNFSWVTNTSSSGGSGLTNQPFNSILYSSGTNMAAIDCSLGDAAQAYYKITLTNNAYFGVPSSVSTNAKTYSIWFQQDSTGTWDVTWTNAYFKFAGGVQKPATNANAITLIQFVTSPFTNGVLYGVPAIPLFQ